MDYSKKNAKRWSVIGQRPAFGLALHALAKENPEVVAVVADVVNSAGLANMKKELPDQVINVGIAEQNMMGIATGLSSEGYTVYTTSFAPFQSMRCLEQIRVNQGYMGQKVVMVGLAGGAAYGELGFTHCTIEDVAILRAIPNIAVVTPADCMEVAKAVEAAADYPGSVYIRLMDKTGIPMVYEEDYKFAIGKAVPIMEGGDIAILANGPQVHHARMAAKRYKEDHGRDVAVYDFHTVKPLDEELLSQLAGQVKAIVTVEEHSILGGLGSAVAEFYANKPQHPLVYRMGFEDEYPHGASHETLLSRYQIDEAGIYGKIMDVVAEIRK